MKFMKKLNLFSFLLGVVLSGSAVYAATMLANNISYDNTSSGINANNVQDAIDTLYTKANTSYDEYSGTTTYTPSSSIQIIPTNNKLMKSDITINAIPSSYKNLNATTTVNSNNLLSGTTAYNNLGELITGSVSTDCVSGRISNCKTSTCNIQTGFKPSSIIIFENDAAWQGIGFYNSSYSTTEYYAGDLDASWHDKHRPLSGSFVLYNNSFDLSWGNDSSVFYMACK